MKPLQRKILEQLIAGSASRSSSPKSIVATGRSYFAIRRLQALPAKRMSTKDRSLMLSNNWSGATSHSKSEKRSVPVTKTTLPVVVSNREYLLDLKPLNATGKDHGKFYAGYLRAGAGANGAGNVEVQQALLKAKR